ncbi:MAG: DUF4153 domain-containing protein [Clostridiales bacterium]|nr:DUF4153 domain-containing protein [Clostridiales bacterium]
MGNFSRYIKKVFTGAGLAFGRYPASIACALAVTGLTLARIVFLDTGYEESFEHDFLFNCLYLALVFGAILSLAAVTLAKARFKAGKALLAANLVGPLAALVSFGAIYKFAGIEPHFGGNHLIVSPLAMARMIVLTVISFVAFIVAAALPTTGENESGKGLLRLDFSKAFFMTLKGLFTALVYGWIIFAGVSGVVAAFQALIYSSMSPKVFMTLGTLAGFVAFTIFLGYFPDFSKGSKDPNRESAENQPRFIEVLLGNILVPIMLALTLVLLAWAAKTVFFGMDVTFVALSGIAAAYTIGGIILHMLVSSYEGGLAKFFLRFYPLASFIILAFEAWALVKQIGASGIMLAEYWFILVWLTAALGAILLLTLKNRAYLVIFSLACALALVAVMPGVGYNVIPVKSQTARLESLLLSENMLQDGKLVPAQKEPSNEVMVAITEAVDYLTFANDAKIPAWLKDKGVDYDNFEAIFGFEKAWAHVTDAEYWERDFFGISLGADFSAMDISEYDLALNTQLMSDVKSGTELKVEGQRGTYFFNLKNNLAYTEDPVFEVSLNEELLLQADIVGFVNELKEKYETSNHMHVAPLKDMTLKLESPEIKLMLVFESIESNMDPKAGKLVYFVFIKDIYLTEKPE